MRQKIINQAGDTIIEVMIAIMVLGLSLSAGYAIAARSIRAARQAQEHGEALKRAEGQLEVLKSKASNGDSDLFSSATPFCMIGNTPTPVSSGNCTLNTYYRVQITRAGDLGNKNYQFDLTIQWDSVGTSATDQVTMHYRLIDES